MLPGSCWTLSAAVNGYAGSSNDELITQAAAGRSFQLIKDLSKDHGGDNQFPRFEVRLLEDGYKCWFEFSAIFGLAFSRPPWEPKLFTKNQIQDRIPSVLIWLEQATSQRNQYLWGGTIGPDFDCSGLVQAAFASQEVWLPRDAYQQERFCESLVISPTNYQMLLPGDLLFFGTSQKCTHVAIYKGAGMYCHSSGITDGRNGIGCDSLEPEDTNTVAFHYRSRLRGAGRVVRCHNGITLN